MGITGLVITIILILVVLVILGFINTKEYGRKREVLLIKVKDKVKSGANIDMLLEECYNDTLADFILEL